MCLLIIEFPTNSHLSTCVRFLFSEYIYIFLFVSEEIFSTGLRASRCAQAIFVYLSATNNNIRLFLYSFNFDFAPPPPSFQKQSPLRIWQCAFCWEKNINKKRMKYDTTSGTCNYSRFEIYIFSKQLLSNWQQNLYFILFFNLRL